tara:strand:- start:327 stop:623 length:297 start_codon:yes stop_codon:yes gene_type:complete
MSIRNRLLNKLKEIIRKEIREVTTTGNIAGYNTPMAFSDGGKKSKKKKKKNSTNSTGYKIVDEGFSDGSDKFKKELKKTAEVLGYNMVGEIEEPDNLE